jgi:hypothetical protein
VDAVTVLSRAAIALAAGAALLTGCAATGSSYPTGAASPQHTISRQAQPAVSDRPFTRTSRHLAAQARRHRAPGVPADVPMPDRSLTPGSIQSSDTGAICKPGWSEAHRDVSYATEDQVAADYGLSSHYGYEIDHLIPLELGGSNAVSNLWPENYRGLLGGHAKDRLENYLHDAVAEQFRRVDSQGAPMSASRCAVQLVVPVVMMAPFLVPGRWCVSRRPGWPCRRGAAGEGRRLPVAIRAAARMAPGGARMRQAITQPA